MERKQLEEKYYIKGRTEGFFDVKMTETENLASNLKENYEEGFKIGKSRSEIKQKDDIVKWNDNRNKFISTEGYWLGMSELNDDEVYITTRYLSVEDKEVFTSGLKKAKKEIKKKETTIDNYLESKRHKRIRK